MKFISFLVAMNPRVGPVTQKWPSKTFLPVSADNCTGVAYGLLAQPVRRALAHIEVFRCLLGFFSGKPLVQPGVDCRAEQ